MTEVEFNKILDAILPKIVGGMVRPDEPIPTDLDFSTAFRQFLQQDANLADHENAFLRRLLSNDKRLQEWVDQIFDSLAKQDFNLATTKLKGLMSAVDKAKLDNIQNGAEVNQNSFSVVKTGTTNISATSEADTIEFASGSNIVLTPSGKKIEIKVNGIANGAEVNQNAFSSVQVGTTKVAATTKTDILNIAAGKNIEIIPDPATKKITIQVLGDLGINLRKANTAYAVGDIAYSPLLPSWARLECVVAGKTSASEIVIPANLSGGGI